MVYTHSTNQMKNAFALAEKEQTDKKLKQFKEIILKTLELLDEKQEEQKNIVREIQILKADIKNFKDGRLDLIEERQGLNPLAKRTSIIEARRKEEQEENAPIWQIGYEVDYKESTINLTNGFCRNNTSGTYKLSSDNIKYI